MSNIQKQDKVIQEEILQSNIEENIIEEPVIIIETVNEEDEERAERIDLYFKSRNMPLEGYGNKFIEEANKNDIDWRLLPAISVKESSGGKYICHSNPNPFGWNSCKTKFDSIEEAIEVVSWNLGGNNPNTERYYKNKSVYDILYSYNGVVEPLYPARVIDIMETF